MLLLLCREVLDPLAGYTIEGLVALWNTYPSSRSPHAQVAVDIVSQVSAL